MQTVRLFKLTCDDVGRKVRWFLWEGNVYKVIYLVRWGVIIRPKKMGRLRVHAMRKLDVVTLTKLGYRLTIEPEVLWLKF